MRLSPSEVRRTSHKPELMLLKMHTMMSSRTHQIRGSKKFESECTIESFDDNNEHVTM